MLDKVSSTVNPIMYELTIAFSYSSRLAFEQSQLRNQADRRVPDRTQSSKLVSHIATLIRGTM